MEVAIPKVHYEKFRKEVSNEKLCVRPGCGKVFKRPFNYSPANWARRKHCSKKCASLSMVTWTPERIQELRQAFPTTPNRVLAERFGTTMQALRVVASKHGMKKSKAYVAECNGNNKRGKITTPEKRKFKVKPAAGVIVHRIR